MRRKQVKNWGTMTYHYNITRYRSIKDTRLWTDRIFLSLLILTALVITYYNNTPSNLLYAAAGITCLAIMLLLITRRQKVPFVGIADGTLTYFDSGRSQMVSVPIDEITHISTRFCLLNVHTPESVHTLNLGLVRNEKTRWEIKEMIREMARRAPEYR